MEKNAQHIEKKTKKEYLQTTSGNKTTHSVKNVK